MKKKSVLAFLFIVTLLQTKAQSPGDVIITEFMPDPAKVADGSGEWLEIYNTTTQGININKWHLRDGSTKNHTISSKVPLIIPPSGFMLLAVKADSAINGGLRPDYVYSNFSFPNNSGRIVLTDSNLVIIDSIRYLSVNPGKAWNLNPLHFNGKDNDNIDYWCVSTTVYGTGDQGTPKRANINCAISEIAIPENISALNIYPNPVTNNITVHHHSAIVETIEVYNISGILIRKYERIRNPTVQLHLDDLLPGTYVLHVHTSDGVASREKIVIP